MKKTMLLFAMSAICSAFAAPSGITVSLKLDETNYVVGERVRGVIDVSNMLADKISVGYTNSEDRLFVEIIHASDGSELERGKRRPFTAPFWIKSNEGQKLEVFLGDHYDLTDPGRYLARPVLVHRGYRYEGLYRSFDVVPGMEISTAMQLFSNAGDKKRVFRLLHWARQGSEHLFLAAEDDNGKRWVTTDVGPMMRITRPTLSIMPNGQLIVFHRNGPDSFVRSEFWSLTDALVIRSRQMVRDPETAGQQRVREMYNKSGAVKPVDRPWWKFW